MKKYNLDKILEYTNFPDKQSVELNFLEKRAGVGYKFNYFSTNTNLIKKDLKLKRLKKNESLNENSSDEKEVITKMDFLKKKFKKNM